MSSDIAPTADAAVPDIHPQDPNEQVSYTITASTSVTLPTHPVPLSYAELNPVSDPTEFFGVLGTAFVTLTCPTVVYFLYYGCNETTGCHPTSAAQWKNVWHMAANNEWPSSAGKWWEWETVPVVLAFFAYLIVCWVALPAPWTKGGLLRDGTRKEYKLNGELYSLIPRRGRAVAYDAPRAWGD
jgi:delta14-sterol reductase